MSHQSHPLNQYRSHPSHTRKPIPLAHHCKSTWLIKSDSAKHRSTSVRKLFQSIKKSQAIKSFQAILELSCFIRGVGIVRVVSLIWALLIDEEHTLLLLYCTIFFIRLSIHLMFGILECGTPAIHICLSNILIQGLGGLVCRELRTDTNTSAVCRCVQLARRYQNTSHGQIAEPCNKYDNPNQDFVIKTTFSVFILA